MTRIRLRTGPVALFGAALVIALLIFLPMRLVLGIVGLGQQGFSARTVEGSVWDGRLNEARFGTLPLGSLDASLSPFALLLGRARVSVHGDPGLIDGAITLSRHGQGIDGMTATLPTGGAFAPLPVSQLSLEAVTVHFTDGLCDSAEGRVRARLIGEAAGIALPAEVSGNARCDGGALLLPLASQSGNEAIDLRITGNGRYTAALRIVPADPAAGERLTAAGFVAGQGGYRLSVEGSF